MSMLETLLGERRLQPRVNWIEPDFARRPSQLERFIVSRPFKAMLLGLVFLAGGITYDVKHTAEIGQEFSNLGAAVDTFLTPVRVELKHVSQSK